MLSGIEIRVIGETKLLGSLLAPKDKIIADLKMQRDSDTAKISELKALLKLAAARIEEKSVAAEVLGEGGTNSEPDDILLAYKASLTLSDFSAPAHGEKISANRAMVLKPYNRTGRRAVLHFQSFDFLCSPDPNADANICGVDLGRLSLKAGACAHLLFHIQSDAEIPLSLWVRHANNKNLGLTATFPTSLPRTFEPNTPDVFVEHVRSSVLAYSSWAIPMDGGVLCHIGLLADAVADDLEMSLHPRQSLDGTHRFQSDIALNYVVSFPAH